MRVFGLLLIILGIFTASAPMVRDSLPLVEAVSDLSLHIMGGCIFVVGAIVVATTGDKGEA
jgi:uncharacterized protein YjeT (DUF2065 family)